MKERTIGVQNAERYQSDTCYCEKTCHNLGRYFNPETLGICVVKVDDPR